MRWTVSELQAALVSGKTTSEKLVADVFERIADPKLEGTKVFTRLHKEAAVFLCRSRHATCNPPATVAGTGHSPAPGLADPAHLYNSSPISSITSS